MYVLSFVALCCLLRQETRMPSQALNRAMPHSRNQLEEGVNRKEIIFTPPPVGGRGIVIERFPSFFVYVFLCLFLCQQHYEKTAGPIYMKFSGIMGRPDSILGQFG